jgi:hypothetical protein
LIRPANTNKRRSVVDIEFFAELIIMFRADGYYIPSVIANNFLLDVTSAIRFIQAVDNATMSFLRIAAILPVANPASATAIRIPAAIP